MTKKKEINIGFEALKKMTIQQIMDIETVLQFNEEVKNGIREKNKA